MDCSVDSDPPKSSYSHPNMYLLCIRKGLSEQELEKKDSIVRLPSFFFSCHCIQEQKSNAVFSSLQQQYTTVLQQVLVVLSHAVGWQPCLEGVEAMCTHMKRLEHYVGLCKQSECIPGAVRLAIVFQTWRGNPLLDHEISLVEMYIALCTKYKRFVNLLFTCVWMGSRS